VKKKEFLALIERGSDLTVAAPPVGVVNDDIRVADLILALQEFHPDLRFSVRAVDRLADPNPEIKIGFLGMEANMNATRAVSREVAYVAAPASFPFAAVPGAPQPGGAPKTQNPLEEIPATIAVQSKMLLIELFPQGPVKGIAK
jgi:hypothetical protein